jgi:hypothetical protein
MAPPGDLDVLQETVSCRNWGTKRDSSNWQFVAGYVTPAILL